MFTICLEPRWAAIGMGSKARCAAMGLCPCKRRAKEIARLRPNPKGKRLVGRSAALQRLRGRGQIVNTFLDGAVLFFQCS